MHGETWHVIFGNPGECGSGVHDQRFTCSNSKADVYEGTKFDRVAIEVGFTTHLIIIL